MTPPPATARPSTLDTTGLATVPVQSLVSELCSRILATASAEDLAGALSRRRILDSAKSDSALTDFVQFVADFFGLRSDVLISPSRHSHLAWKRWVGMAALREISNLDLRTIANAFGRGDHGSTLWAVKKVKESPILLDHKARLLRVWREQALDPTILDR